MANFPEKFRNYLEYGFSASPKCSKSTKTIAGNLQSCEFSCCKARRADPAELTV